MARTALRHIGPLAAGLVACVAPADGLTEPAKKASSFYGIAEPTVGYAFGTATYDGPIFSGATSSYEARFRGVSVVTALGAAYRLSASFSLGARALGDSLWTHPGNRQFQDLDSGGTPSSEQRLSVARLLPAPTGLKGAARRLRRHAGAFGLEREGRSGRDS
jgi:hypothetical protein